MLDLDRTMFFKAKFDVAENSDGDALWSVIMCLKRWSLKKARYGDYRLPSEPHAWSELKHGDKIVADGANVSLFSCMHREGDVYTWACQHSEVSRKIGCAPREWTTEIGFEGHTRSSGTVSIITIYSDVPGFLGPLQETPSPTIPGLVRFLANDDQLTCTVDGCPLSLEPIEFEIDGCAGLYEKIANPAREVPVIVCAPSHGGRLSLDPETIVRQLGPNALVYFTRNCEAMNALNALFPANDLGCFGGAVRIYAARPDFTDPSDSYKHRYFSTTQIREHGIDYHYAILRRALAEDVHFWETLIRIDDVKRLNRHSHRERDTAKRMTEIESAAIDQLTAMFDEVDERAESAETDRDRLKDELTECRNRLRDADARIAAYEHSFSSQRDCSLARALNEHPQLNLTTIAKLFVEAYPDRLDFSARGWESLEGCVTAPDVFWHALHCMCTVLHPLYSERGAGIAKAFRERTRLSLSFKESETTRKNAALMRQREDTYEGRPLIIEPHIRSGTGDPNSPKFVHIYFNRDEKTGRLVIGATQHLDTSTTPKL